jgi:uncharacterized protein YkwD
MGSAASISSLKDHSQEEVIDRCAILYANDPMFFEFVVAEAKKKATSEQFTGNTAASTTTTNENESKNEAPEPAAATQATTAGQEEKSAAETTEPAKQTGSGGTANSIDLLSVINRVRMQPADFITELEKHLSKFVDETVFQLKSEGKTINIRTSEGKAAVAEAIAYLKAAAPAEALKYSPLLERAALDHVRDTFDSKLSGHEVGADTDTTDTTDTTTVATATTSVYEDTDTDTDTET